MVGEFPELQGIMGGYYARHDGLSRRHRLRDRRPLTSRASPATRCRATPPAWAVALADKLETLAGLFGIGQVPTGDKDPFALRRHALGLIRMLIERELPLELAHLVSIAFAAFPATHGQAQAELSYFLRERLVGYLREAGHAGAGTSRR